MEKQTMGDMISTLRKEKGMTQRELAEKLNVTDKAVSKWERNLSCPDIHSIPALAEALGVSVEKLMSTSKQVSREKPAPDKIIGIILRAVPLAMGVALVVTSIMGHTDIRSGFGMMGIGLFCLALERLRWE